MSPDPQRLFSDYAAEQISAEDFHRLQMLLDDDKELRTAFLEYMNTCAFLEDAASYSESMFPEMAETASLPGVSEASDTKAKIIGFPSWAIAAAAAMALGFVTWSLRPVDAPGAISTRVLASHDAQMSSDDRTLNVGDDIALTEIDLLSGRVRLELPRGVVFDIYGPAKGRFESETRFHLESGRLDVDVGEFGKGFTVVTASAEIVDLGTHFGVEIGDFQEARVAVFSGEVEVHSRERGSSPRLLTEGEGVQVSSGGLASRLMSITIPDKGDSDNETPPFTRTSNFDIRDNQSTEDNLRYYGIIAGGMREGARVYTTHPSVRWRSIGGESFPTEIVGADLIQTFNNDRKEGKLAINLSVNTPSTVYVMFDDRYEPPRWLRDNFTATGQTVVSGPWRPVAIVHDILPDSQGRFYVNYKVWRADLSENQEVELGESFNSESPEDLRAMYGIAVKPKQDVMTASVINTQN
jgi:ferric-dicitrate binding protein FerR (iron transport regulator)